MTRGRTLVKILLTAYIKTPQRGLLKFNRTKDPESRKVVPFQGRFCWFQLQWIFSNWAKFPESFVSTRSKGDFSWIFCGKNHSLCSPKYTHCCQDWTCHLRTYPNKNPTLHERMLCYSVLKRWVPPCAWKQTSLVDLTSGKITSTRALENSSMTTRYMEQLEGEI